MNRKPHRHSPRFCLAACLLAAVIAVRVPAQTLQPAPPAAVNAPPEGEPTTAEEATLQKKYGDKVTIEAYRAYRRLVEGLPEDEKRWEGVLEVQLGGFYFPIHLRQRLKPDFRPESSEWGFVRDDPALPRVLLIGDSISRAYTVPVRRGLAGKANVHRAPANCGPTDSGLRNMDTWLDQGTRAWDIIHFNFGIHDRRKTAEEYAANLDRVIGRLQQTGATLVWARTTPFGPNIARGEDESIPLNRVADEVVRRHGIAVCDLHSAVIGRIAEVQGSDHTHFQAEGVRLLAEQVVKTLAACLGEARGAQAPGE
ncbi:MAG: SGNH/GDSL hydrolase family protein [Lentisphaeria bacterium]|nr:SGNH/GDSL hydrolase family protein [Lentisphaeria bacterium]